MCQTLAVGSSPNGFCPIQQYLLPRGARTRERRLGSRSAKEALEAKVPAGLRGCVVGGTGLARLGDGLCLAADSRLFSAGGGALSRTRELDVLAARRWAFCGLLKYDVLIDGEFWRYD